MGRILTGDADVGFATLGGPRRAPGYTLTPEVFRAEEFLHLLPGYLYAGLPHHQACEGRTEKGSKGRRRQEKEKERMRQRTGMGDVGQRREKRFRKAE